MQKVILIFLLLTSSIVNAQDVKILNLKSNDVIYLSSTDRLYVSISEDAEYSNSLCVVNPYYGTIDTCYAIGGLPGVMAFSDDEKYIYIGLLSSPEIARFDVVGGTIGLRIPLGIGGDSQGPYYAEDIAVVPGAPQVIAVALMNPDVLPWHAGIAVYENGLIRPTILSASMGSNSIAFDTETGFLYGYRNETNSDLAVRKMSVNENGVFVEGAVTGLLDRVYDEIKYADGKLYSNFGKVISLSNDALALEASFGVGFTFPVVQPAVDSNIVFFLNAANAAISFQTFSKNSYAIIDQLNFPNIKGNPYKLIQWGGEGKVAFITRDFFSGFNSRLVIMRTCTSTITEAPIVEFSGSACSGDTVRLYAEGSEGRIFWSDGQIGPVAKLIYSNVIFCSIADDQGCLSPSSDPVLISFYQYPSPPLIYLSDNALFLYSPADYGFGMQWFLNGEPIPGADSSALEVAESGVYTFQVNWGECLSPVSNEISVIVSSLQDPREEANYRFFPNPAIDRAFLRLSSPVPQKGVIRISTLEGKLLTTQVLLFGQTLQEFSLAGLPAGLYIVQAFTDGGRLIAAGRLAKL